MTLPRLSRLYPDAARNLCAGASPVARVPVTPSAVFDFRPGVLSPPQQPIRAGQNLVRGSRMIRECALLRWAQLPLGPPEPASANQLLEASLLFFHVGLSSWNGASPLECALTKKRPSKSFRIHSYKFIGL